MNSNRKYSIIAGLLFITATVTAIIGVLLYHPILTDPEYIIKRSADEKQVLWGVFFEIILSFAVIGTSVTLFPILKKYNERMAIGTVCFRLLESALIIIGMLSLLSIVTLNHEFLKENTNASAYLVTGKLLLAIHDWTFLYGPNLILGPSTFMTSYLLYKLKLVPRFISILGLVGGPLISACAVLVISGAFLQISGWGLVLAVPVFVYEMALAAWLLVKGFNSPSTADNTATRITQFGR